MARTSLFDRLRDRLRSFRSAKRGHVAITFALATIPVVGLTGAAVDYSRANLVKTDMQAALDSTALMLAKDPNVKSMSSGTLQSKALSYFTAQFDRPEALNVGLQPVNLDMQAGTVTLKGSAMIKTAFMSLVQVPFININVDSTVNWSVSRLRVALVLDNTGSMASSNKMTALKTASHNLLTQLKNAVINNGDVYVSIIPFSKDVAVDPSNYNASWVDFTDHGSWAGWDSNNGSCNKSGYYTKSTCTSNHGHWTPNNHNTWNGCVTDRDQDHDTLNTAPAAGTQATLFPAEQYSNCPVAMMGLSYDWTALNNKIDAMQPNGNTNQAIGLQWGWQSLTAAPFTIPAMDPSYQYQQVIILLTDGLNTEDRWYTSASSIDTRQQKTCDNVKAAGITLYTVQVNTGGDPTSTLLQNCASDSSKFFLLTSANDIVATFAAIGTKLSQLRVAK